MLSQLNLQGSALGIRTVYSKLSNRSWGLEPTRHCTYKVTLQRIRVSSVAVETQQYVFVFFPHINGRIFEKKNIITEDNICGWIFLYKFVENISHSKKN
jgi:hypothetical protein